MGLFKNGLTIIYPEKKKAITDQKQTKIVKSIKIYITGTVEGITKQELRDMMEEKGIIWGSGVSKSMDYLVLGENAGEKRQEQAKALGVKVIPWEEFKEKYLD